MTPLMRAPRLLKRIEAIGAAELAYPDEQHASKTN
jgi:hypothetical protein